MDKYRRPNAGRSAYFRNRESLLAMTASAALLAGLPAGGEGGHAAHVDAVVFGSLWGRFGRFWSRHLFSRWLSLRLGLAFSGFGFGGLNLGSGI